MKLFIEVSVLVCVIFLLDIGDAQPGTPSAPFVDFTYPNTSAKSEPSYPFPSSSTYRQGQSNVEIATENCFRSRSVHGVNDSAVEGTTGKCLHPTPIRFKDSSGSVFSFSTVFVAVVILGSPSVLRRGYGTYGSRWSNNLEGFAFAILPDYNISVGGDGGYLGLLNATGNGNPQSHAFAVEIDTVQSPEFSDPDFYHIGVDINNMNSSSWAGIDGPSNYWDTDDRIIWELQVWIDYDSSTQALSVAILDISQSICPAKSLGLPNMMDLSIQLDLSNVLNEYMYVGFTSARSSSYSDTLRDSTNVDPDGNDYLFGIYGWSFSTANSTTSARSSSLTCFPRQAYITKRTLWDRHPYLVNLVSVLGALLVLSVIYSIIYSVYVRWDERRKWRFNIDADLEAGPHTFTYRELALSTNNFSAKQALGRGGFGSVYKGFLPGNQQYVAIKRVSRESKQGEREFLAEVTIIGRIRHRNLVRLQGWCHERGELLLVYDYMPEGSVDKLLFDGHAVGAEGKLDGDVRFPWERRFKIIRDVASALVYLHYECEERIIHRDVKAANVMLDSKFNARLGDFGLARSYQHSLLSQQSTNVAGTFGYLAPELYHTGKQTEQTDVFSYGVFILEVACGRKPIHYDSSNDVVLLLDYVWDQWSNSRISDAADPKLAELYNVDELTKVLCLGLLCTHPDPAARPSMRHVLLILTGDIALPTVPTSKPHMVFSIRRTLSKDLDTTTTVDYDSDHTQGEMEVHVPPSRAGTSEIIPLENALHSDQISLMRAKSA